jgi:hypothetical protein
MYIHVHTCTYMYIHVSFSYTRSLWSLDSFTKVVPARDTGCHDYQCAMRCAEPPAMMCVDVAMRFDLYSCVL